MSWDAHVVMAVSQPGPAEEGCGGLYHCLPPLVPGVSSQPLPPHSGHSKLCREGAFRVGSLQDAGIGAGTHSAWCPKPGAGHRKEPSRECWEMGLGGQSFRPVHVSRGKEDAIWKRTPSLVCLVISAPSLSAVLLPAQAAVSLLHRPLPGHAAGTGSPLLLAKGLCTCPQPASW